MLGVASGSARKRFSFFILFTGIFVFIAAAMGVVMATIGFFGPRATNLALEEISH